MQHSTSHWHLRSTTKPLDRDTEERGALSLRSWTGSSATLTLPEQNLGTPPCCANIWLDQDTAAIELPETIPGHLEQNSAIKRKPSSTQACILHKTLIKEEEDCQVYDDNTEETPTTKKMRTEEEGNPSQCSWKKGRFPYPRRGWKR